MQEPLITTNNNLHDIINWLHIGDIVCIHAFGNAIFYSKKEDSKDTINNSINPDKKLIYVDLEKNPGLLDEEEWPYYIEKEGFIRHTDKNSLPTKSENIYAFSI